MNNIDRENFFDLDRKSFYELNNTNIKKVVDILNTDKLVIIKGLKNIGKINFIKEFINKTKLIGSYFYFNKSSDIENKISTGTDLSKLLDEFIRLYKIPKIIILQDVSNIEGIKEFISSIYKQNYKTILVGNTVKIGGIKELEILANIDINKENLISSLKYGFIQEVKIIEQSEVKERYLNLAVSDIFLYDIFKNYGVKSIELYIFTMKFLANNNEYFSLRELQKKLDYIQKISIKTTIDYVDFSMQEKIIKRSYLYDIKNSKAITTKAKYYFSDNGIRNSLADFRLTNDLLVENLIFNKLELYNYEIYGGSSGIFDFSFYAVKNNNGFVDNTTSHLEKVYIHISIQNSKEEVKKEVNKFQKIGDEFKKYILVKSLDDLGINKTSYADVEIMEIDDFLIKF